MNKTQWNPICETCLYDCKQPPAVTMVSCPKFNKAEKKLDLFDKKGRVKPSAINPAGGKKNKKRQ